jgi:hypothetical protein
MGSTEMEYQKIEYYSPGGSITKFEGLLIDYYSEKNHPTPFYIEQQMMQAFHIDEPVIKSKLGIGVPILAMDQLSGWTITGIEESAHGSLSVIQFEKFPKFIRIRFVILQSKKSAYVEQIAKEIVTKWLLLGYSVLPFDLENEEELKSIPSKHEGMSDWRKRRAYLFKETKDKNPLLSKDKVAIKSWEIAQLRIKIEIHKRYPPPSDDQFDEIVKAELIELYGRDTAFTEDDVRNDYRVMDWDWADSRKIH